MLYNRLYDFILCLLGTTVAMVGAFQTAGTAIPFWTCLLNGNTYKSVRPTSGTARYLLYVTGTSSRPLLRQVTSSHTPIWRDDQFHARDDQKCDNDLKKDIHSGWSSSYKNADICLFDVFKNTCQVLCHRTYWLSHNFIVTK